jgi:hypothetical protein
MNAGHEQNDGGRHEYEVCLIFPRDEDINVYNVLPDGCAINLVALSVSIISNAPTIMVGNRKYNLNNCKWFKNFGRTLSVSLHPLKSKTICKRSAYSVW